MDTVELVPDDRAGFGLGHVLALFRPQHNFGERSLRVETVPPNAQLDLFYVRANFQKRFERAEAPVRVLLPRRIDAGSRDAVTVRAYREGYQEEEVTVLVDSGTEALALELDPLPNRLVSASHVYFAGRGALTFLTEESLQVRVQRREEGFRVILAETALADGAREALEGLESPLVRAIEARQLGEDLMVRVETGASPKEAGLELRARQSHDALRDLHAYSVDLVPQDGGAHSVERAREALARLEPSAVRGCAARWGAALREALDDAALSRALAPSGSFTDRYLRAAMRRLGELSPQGRIQMRDDRTFEPSSAIELAAAMSEPAEAEGYLALLRAFVRELEGDERVASGLRSLLAPESGSEAFAEALEAAERAESECEAGGGSQAAARTSAAARG